MKTYNNYNDFLQAKVKSVKTGGFECDIINPKLKDFQAYIVKKALLAGKYAVFADCGLGKTFMQLEWSYQVAKHNKGKVLVIAPLAVVEQTKREGNKFGIDMSAIDVINYEQIENYECSIYCGVVIDESSILKNFTGKTKQLIIDKFSGTQYKLACTATPSPNDVMELGNHAEFLDIMSRNEMLAMYFVHDGGDTAKWRIKGHAKNQFYKFVNSWATMISKPSDIGFSDDGYVLPELCFFEKVIQTNQRDNGKLFNDVNVSATTFNKELRITKHERLESVAKLVNASNEPWIVWVKQNEESDLACSLISDAVDVKGSDTPEKKKNLLLGFANGDFRVLVTKTKIAQFGLNYQHCNNQVFASLDFSFEGLYQAIRRSYRFGQSKPVNIHLITTDTMQNVVQSINKKQQQFNEMRDMMKDAICESNASTFDVNESTVKIDGSILMRGDCVKRIKEVDSESIGLSVFSPPFAELYTYSSHVEDMGNSKDYKEFNKHFGFLCTELYRVMMHGRNVAIHCMDLPIQKGKEGYIGLRDFSGMIISAMEDAGFVYHSRITIWKNPVIEMQRTKALGLLHKQVKKDSTMSRVGIPDYVLVFRKDGDRVSPVENTELPVDLWQKYASPVWMDIDYGDTLNYRSGRDDNDEKHICPLQLPTIKRLVHLYSNVGDTVLTPFMGIGSEVYQSCKMGRNGIGIELKESYFELAIKNVRSALLENNQLSIL